MTIKLNLTTCTNDLTFVKSPSGFDLRNKCVIMKAFLKCLMINPIPLIGFLCNTFDSHNFMHKP